MVIDGGHKTNIKSLRRHITNIWSVNFRPNRLKTYLPNKIMHNIVKPKINK